MFSVVNGIVLTYLQTFLKGAYGTGYQPLIARPPFNTKVMVMASQTICQKPSSRAPLQQFKAFKLKYIRRSC